MVDKVDPVQTVRLLIADVDTNNPLITDEQIQVYLDLNTGRVRRAAADALDAIAVSEALVSKKIRTQDLTTDGPALAAELRAHAKRLRDQGDAEEDDTWGGFSLVDTLPASRRPEHTQHEAWGL